MRISPADHRQFVDVRGFSTMALQELVRYVGCLCAQKPNCHDLYWMAEKYDWNADDVLAFVRCYKARSKRMLRDMAKELDGLVSNLEHILNR